MEFILTNLAFIIIPFVYITLVFIAPIIEKNQIAFVVLAFILSALSYVVGGQFIEWTVFSGHFSFALFMLVIFAGLMRRDSMYRQVIEPVRGDLSIYGFIYLIPHIAFYFSEMINGYNMMGIVAYVIMIPLIVSSFRNVRKNMKKELWQVMHKLSYVIYFLLYLHVGFNFRLSPLTLTVKPLSMPFHFTFVVYVMIKVVFIIANMNERKKVQ